MPKAKPIRKSVMTPILGRMEENDITNEEAGKIIGASRDTFRRRAEAPDEMTLGELKKLCKALDISADELTPYIIS